MGKGYTAHTEQGPRHFATQAELVAYLETLVPATTAMQRCATCGTTVGLTHVTTPDANGEVRPLCAECYREVN